MTYEDQIFKIPKESDDYSECSNFITSSIEKIIKNRIEEKINKIVINTNLKLGLPMENINKIAGPFVEAWAVESFHDVLEDQNNQYHLVNVEAVERLHMADVILQFKRKRKFESGITAEIDVKATAENIASSGKGPNITSFKRIRTAYVKDPDYLFIILSLKHKVYSTRNEKTDLMDGIMEIVSCNAYDIKFIAETDLMYNPALGTGQIQIKDIHYVDLTNRSTWEFCRLLDNKYLKSSRRDFGQWLILAKKHKWVK